VHEPSTTRALPSTPPLPPRIGSVGVQRQRVGRGLAAALLAVALAGCGASVTSTPTEGDAQPASAFVVSPATPLIDVAVTFDARAIACPAAPCTFVWDDVTGEPWRLGEGDVLMVTFTGEGTKRVRLTVTDADGHVVTHVEELDVLATGRAPVPRPSVPEFVTLPGDEPLTRPPDGRGLERRPVEPPGLEGRDPPKHAGPPHRPR
jgi:hypothetical protein